MAAPMAIGAITSLIPSIFQMGTGITQLLRGMNKPVRPEYIIPTAVKEAEAAAERNAAMTGMPGQAMMQGRIDENVGSALYNIKQQGGRPAAVADILSKKNEADINLGIQGANFVQGMQRDLQNVKANVARYQDRAWDWNQMQKFQEEAAASSALQQAGMENLFSGLSNISGVASYETQNPMMSMFNNLFGKKQPETPGQSTLTGTGVLTPQPEFKSRFGSVSPQGFIDPNLVPQNIDFLKYIFRF